jgi:hypothetical protein
MKVIPNDKPLDRLTLVELTDKEIQFIARGLLNDSRDNDANGDLYGEFDNLMDDLLIDPIPQ